MPVGVACPRPDLTVAVVSSIFVSSEYVPRLLAGRAEVVEGTVPEWPRGKLLPLLPRRRWVSVLVVPWGAYSYASVRQRTQQVPVVPWGAYSYASVRQRTQQVRPDAMPYPRPRVRPLR